MTIQAMGNKPREEVVVFKWGENPTDKYGPLLFDAADAIEVMRRHRQRGVLLPWDVEHASRKGGPLPWQESHAWSDLKVDHRGLVAVVDYNANGVEKVVSRAFPYDSPVVNRWRGNHVRDVEMFALVKEPARNGSTPLLMSNTTTPRAKLLLALHAALGALVDAANAARSEADLVPILDQIAGATAEPAMKISELCVAAGAATEKPKPEDKPAPALPEPPKQPAQPPAMMSNRDELAELGAEVLARLKAKSKDDAMGLLEGLLNPGQALMSNGVCHESHALLLSAQAELKVSKDEVDAYKGKSPAFVKAFLSNRGPLVNTDDDKPKPAPASKEEPTSIVQDDDYTRAIAATKIGSN